MRIDSKTVSGIVTLLFAICVGVFLGCTQLTLDPSKPANPEPDPYIAMDFLDVEVDEMTVPPPPAIVGGDAAAPALTPEDLDDPSELAPETGVSLKDNGPKAEETPKPVTTNRPSPVKTEKVEKPIRPTGPQVDNQQQQKEIQARQTANKDVKNAFNKPTSNGNANNRQGDTGLAGRKDGVFGSAGSTDSKSRTPGVGMSKLSGGWGWPKVPTNITSSEVGSVTIELRLKPDGTVEKATVTRNQGLTEATISRCLDKARTLKFSHPANTEIGTTATLTYTFKD